MNDTVRAEIEEMVGEGPDDALFVAAKGDDASVAGSVASQDRVADLLAVLTRHYCDQYGMDESVMLNSVLAKSIGLRNSLRITERHGGDDA